MLSYRHAFHAGNHADVLKHIVLVECIARMKAKDKSILYVDTHAGGGLYTLGQGYAAQNNERESGIDKIRAACTTECSGAGIVAAVTTSDSAAQATSCDPAEQVARRYLAALENACPRGASDVYPGSPLLASSLLKAGDRLVLFELHPADHANLRALFAGPAQVPGTPGVEVRRADGFAGLRSVLPPPSRRGLVLVDPSYELAADYAAVVTMLRDALSRFATGVYLVWYPLLERAEAVALPDALRFLAPRWLDARLRVRGNLPGERGMHGSGLFIINPPWQLRQTMDGLLPWLATVLGTEGSTWHIESEGE